MDSEQTALSSGQFLGLVRRRFPWILICVVLLSGAAYGYSKHKTKKYTAAAAIAFNSSQLGQQIAGLSTNGGANPLLQQQSNLELVKVGDTTVRTARLLGQSPEKVAGSLKIGVKGESTIVDVSATATSPRLAAAIANTYASQFAKEQQSANRRFFKTALLLVNRQLSELSPVQRFGSDGLDLQNRAHTLALLVALGYNTVEVAQRAQVPSSPSSPKVHKDVAIAAVLGLLLGLIVASLLEHFDRRLSTPEELEAIYGLPMLGAVPKSSVLARLGRRQGRKRIELPPAEAEAFNLIRAHLRFFNIDREVRTVVIASPTPGDGKTTIARHLAEAATRLGSRVLLLEVDLRHPTIAQQLDTEGGPGLAEVLIGAVPVGEAIQSVELQALAGGTGITGHMLDVLTAGAVLPPNPGELLDSHAMAAVLERVGSTYDLVVIDTPPLTLVSDAFPLLPKVDGVIIVGWVGRSRRDAAERLHQVLAGSGAPLLGVIANGSKTNGPGYYGSSGRNKTAAVVTTANGAASSEEFVPIAKA